MGLRYERNNKYLYNFINILSKRVPKVMPHISVRVWRNLSQRLAKN